MASCACPVSWQVVHAKSDCLSFSLPKATVTIPVGTQLAVWQWPGDTYGEISFQIYGPAGNLLLDSGQGPGAGQLDVLNCL